MKALMDFTCPACRAVSKFKAKIPRHKYPELGSKVCQECDSTSGYTLTRLDDGSIQIESHIVRSGHRYLEMLRSAHYLKEQEERAKAAADGVT
jgi:hypothetical protein